MSNTKISVWDLIGGVFFSGADGWLHIAYGFQYHCF